MADAAPGGALPPAGAPSDPSQVTIPGASLFQSTAGMQQAQTSAQVATLPGAQLFAQPQAQPAMVPGAQLFGGPGSSTVDSPSSGQKNALFTAMPTGQDLAKSAGVNPSVYGALADVGSKTGSAVNSAMKWSVALPMRAMTGAIVNAGAAVGVPGAADLQARTGGKILPDAYFSDITDFAIDKAAKAAGVDQMGSEYRTLVTMTKAGVGMAANILGDPIALTRWGQLTDAAKELQSAGDVASAASQERNLVSARIPFTDLSGSIPMSAVKPIADTLQTIPGASTVVKAVRAFSPNTGVPEVDLAGNTYDSLKRGGAAQLIRDYLGPMANLSYSEDERGVMTALGEASANVAPPNASPSLLKAAGGALSGTPDSVRAEMHAALPGILGDHGVTLAPGRDDALIEGALAAKISGARYNDNLIQAGKLTPSNVADKVLPNHMPHVMDPKYEGMKGAEDIEEAFNSKTPRPLAGSNISSRDITRMRTMSGTVADLNQEIEGKTGMKNFFITDPHVATAVREVQSQKLLRDSQYLDTIGKYGERATPGLISEGWRPIQHPEFEGKTLVLKGEGGTRTVALKDMVFPPEIAAKVAYRMGAPAVNNITGHLGGIADWLGKTPIGNLNRVLRATTFASPGMFLRNAGENFVKALARGTTSQTFGDTMSVLRGDFDGFRSAGSALNRSGTFYSGKQIQSLLDKFGITATNSLHEGMSSFLGQMKKSTLTMGSALNGRSAAEFAESMLGKVAHYGEKGENLSRAALFVQRLKDGYTPEMAAHEVTTYLFDYTRNSPATNAARFFFPFVQHPIKSVGIYPELVGGAPGLFNAANVTLPHVMANAFHDPVSQEEINQILPGYLRMRDAIAGPLIPGNTWLSSIFSNPKSPGELGQMAYFTPEFSGQVMDQFNYFNQAARDERARADYGLSPFFSSLLHVMRGTDNDGHAVQNNLAELFRNGVLRNVSFPNTWKIATRAMGIGDPKTFEPATVLAMRGLFGQMGGVTNLDRDVVLKLTALSMAAHDIKTRGISDLRQLGKSAGDPQTLSQYFKGARSVAPMTNQDLFAEAKQKMQEKMADVRGQAQGVQAATAALSGKSTPEDFVSRLKGIHQEIERINQGYQWSAQRYIDMAKGSKSPAEARARSGVDQPQISR